MEGLEHADDLPMRFRWKVAPCPVCRGSGQIQLRWHAWLTPDVVGLANAIYEERRWEDLPILADALEDAGCDHGSVLMHCRGMEPEPGVSPTLWRPLRGPHCRGCWVVDLLLGKE